MQLTGHSLRQSTRRTVFSGLFFWQLSPISVAIFDLNSGPQNGTKRSIILRTARFSPNLWTPPIQSGSRNLIVSRYLCASVQSGLVISLGYTLFQDTFSAANRLSARA